jgi:hypothetical protein
VERSSKVGWLVIVFRNGWVERSSGVGWLAIRGAVIISWMARDQCPGWLVERSSSVGWLVKVTHIVIVCCVVSKWALIGAR